MKERHTVMLFPNYIFIYGSKAALGVYDIKSWFYFFNMDTITNWIPRKFTYKKDVTINT